MDGPAGTAPASPGASFAWAIQCDCCGPPRPLRAIVVDRNWSRAVIGLVPRDRSARRRVPAPDFEIALDRACAPSNRARNRRRSFYAGTAAIARGHVRRRPGLIEEHQPLDAQAGL